MNTKRLSIQQVCSILMVCAMLLSACSGIVAGQQTVKGSGKLTSEPRSVSGFTAVSLEGSGNVEVAIGPNETLVVEADDNILPLIETVLEKSVLVIRTKPNTNIHTNNPIRILITAKSLSGVMLPGSGSLRLSGLSGDSFSIALPGSGNITVGGASNQVSISLGGSGNIYCDGLKAKTATVTLNGSGTVTVYASESLDATIRGSGDIRYSGSPAKVNKNVSGSGSIHE